MVRGEGVAVERLPCWRYLLSAIAVQQCTTVALGRLVPGRARLNCNSS